VTITNLDDNYLGKFHHDNPVENPMNVLSGEIRYLALETIVPITGDPQTEYEIGAVRSLMNFGFNLLCYLEGKGLIEVKKP